jgi:bacterioferritin-associated ferredoxin
MIVCSCNVLSETEVRSACGSGPGPRTPGQVYRCLGCSPHCGRCARTIRTIIDQTCPARVFLDEPAESRPAVALAEAAE